MGGSGWGVQSTRRAHAQTVRYECVGGIKSGQVVFGALDRRTRDENTMLDVVCMLLCVCLPSGNVRTVLGDVLLLLWLFGCMRIRQRYDDVLRCGQLLREAFSVRLQRCQAIECGVTEQRRIEKHNYQN